MIYEHLNANDKILYIGIGTGLSATAFHKLGLEIYGLDYSEEMLEVCKKYSCRLTTYRTEVKDVSILFS